MRKFFKSAKGAIDLPSIMIGVVVIGIFSGIIGATVFVAIPWSQDKAASNSLSSISAAQTSYRQAYDQYTTYDTLVEKGLMKKNPNYCSTTNGTGKTYDSASKSATGKIFVNNASQLKPREAYANEQTCLGKYIPSVPTSSTSPTTAPTTPAAIAPNNNITEFTFNCTAGTTMSLPLENAKGTLQWTKNGATISSLPDTTVNTVSSQKFPTTPSDSRTTKAVYKAKFTGTFTKLSSNLLTADERNCIQSMDSWGESTGTTSAAQGFVGASNLTSVPNAIPSTVTNINELFSGATVFNSPNVSSWNTSNIDTMIATFYRASSFNQSVANWNVSKVKAMNNMFQSASSFNQPLNTWNTSSVTTIERMFGDGSAYNSPLDQWDTSNIVNMHQVFYANKVFNQNISNWQTGKVTDMEQMFTEASAYNQPVNTWDVSLVKSFDGMFSRASTFNQPVSNWKTTSAVDMGLMFSEATSFNQPVNTFNTANVYDIGGMFYGATSFNQPVNNWNTSKVTNMWSVFSGATAFNQPLSAWDTSLVVSMENMFANAKAFNQPLSTFKTGNVQQMGRMFSGATTFNQPLSTWDTTKTSIMIEMFYGATSFNQNISNWTVNPNVTNRSNFSTGSPLIAANTPKFA